MCVFLFVSVFVFCFVRPLDRWSITRVEKCENSHLRCGKYECVEGKGCMLLSTRRRRKCNPLLLIFLHLQFMVASLTNWTLAQIAYFNPIQRLTIPSSLRKIRGVSMQVFITARPQGEVKERTSLGTIWDSLLPFRFFFFPWYFFLLLFLLLYFFSPHWFLGY